MKIFLTISIFLLSLQAFAARAVHGGWESDFFSASGLLSVLEEKENLIIYQGEMSVSYDGYRNMIGGMTDEFSIDVTCILNN